MSSSPSLTFRILSMMIELNLCLFRKKGIILVAADAAQQEYRMLAHYAKEWALIDMIKKGYDVPPRLLPL